MKTLIRFLAVSLVILTTNISQAAYVVTVFAPGNNLFSNPLSDSGFDTLNNLFSTAFPNLPNGTTISLWDSTTSTFDTTSTYNSGSWSINLTLEPGTGAKLNTPLAFTNIFLGNVLNHDGSPLTIPPGLTTPPVFSGSNGIYLLGDKAPTVDTGTDIFLNILGRLPNIGEQVTLLDNLTQTYITSTYLGSGNWDNIPTLDLGDAAFINIESVPEPRTYSLFSVCVLLLCGRMKRPNQSPEPTAVGAGRSAVAVHIASRRWLSFLR